MYNWTTKEIPLHLLSRILNNMEERGEEVYKIDIKKSRDKGEYAFIIGRRKK